MNNGKTVTISQVCLLKRESGEKKGGGEDLGWRGLYMLLGEDGGGTESTVAPGRGREAGNRGGQFSAFLSEGPMKFLELGS